jgi:hypothetical protein
MSNETAFSVHHSCGHDRLHDLSSKPALERAGFARLLAWTPCDDCSLGARSPRGDEPGDPSEPRRRRLCAGR